MLIMLQSCHACGSKINFVLDASEYIQYYWLDHSIHGSLHFLLNSIKCIGIIIII